MRSRMPRYSLSRRSRSRLRPSSGIDSRPSKRWSAPTSGRVSTSLSRNRTPSTVTHSRSGAGPVPCDGGSKGTQSPYASPGSESTSDSTWTAGPVSVASAVAWGSVPGSMRRPSPLGAQTLRPSRSATARANWPYWAPAYGLASTTGTSSGSDASTGSAASRPATAASS